MTRIIQVLRRIAYALLGLPSDTDDLIRDVTRLSDDVSERANVLAEAQADQLKTLKKMQEEVCRIRTCIDASAAIEYSYQNGGKIVILTRAGGRDYVEVLDIEPEMSPVEGREMAEQLRRRFGIRQREPFHWVDTAPGTDTFFRE